MPSSTQTLGEQLVALLEYYDVKTVFGIPGVHTIELYRGLKSSSIRHITPRHEQGAGFMADGYARASGEVGVCLCITGPGMTNIATPMGQAFADSIPMLVISSVNKTHTLGKGRGHLHELKNQQALVSGVAAFSHTLKDASELPQIMAKAYAVFKSSRPRPVHIEIPLELMSLPVSASLPSMPALPAKPTINANTATEVVEKIIQAQRIVLLVGGGCINAQKPLLEFVDLLGAPCCLTINARGLLPPSHPLRLDGVQTIDAFREFVANCDLCIAIGTELGETDYDFYDTGPLHIGGEMVRIDIDEAQLQNNANPTMAIVSDAELALQALCISLSNSPSFKPKQNSEAVVVNLNSALQASFTEPTKQYDALFKAISDAHPQAIIVGDSTKPIYHENFVHSPPAPRHWFNSATGYGTLGYAMPAAIGAKIAKPELCVIAIAGDGGFQFSLNELVVAAQEKIAIAIIVWNNNAYKEIQDYMERNNIPPVGVDVLGPNLELLAAAMHSNYARAESISDISKLLEPLPNLNKPLLIEYVSTVDA